jgi:hypothetical protein
MANGGWKRGNDFREVNFFPACPKSPKADANFFGEHTRPRVFQSAPPPTGFHRCIQTTQEVKAGWCFNGGERESSRRGRRLRHAGRVCSPEFFLRTPQARIRACNQPLHNR